MIDTAQIRHSTSPAVPAVCALVLVVAAFAHFGVSGQAFLAAFISCVLIAVAAIDLDQHRIPNALVLPASAVVLAGQTLLAPSEAAGYIGSGVGTAAALLVVALVYPRGLGMGDVKLGLFLGLALGSRVLLALVIGFVSAAGFSLVLLFAGRGEARKTAIPLAPFLALGGLIMLFMR